jgi:hypothetical protein
MSSQMLTVAQDSTWKTLEKTRNLAATNLLATGLTSQSSAVRVRCLNALMLRRDPSGYRKILQQWDALEEQDIDLLRPYAHRFAAAAGELLSDGSLSEKKLSLRAISELDLTDAADTLLRYVLDERHSLHAAASQCLMEMSHRLGRACRSDRKPGDKKFGDPSRQTLIKKLHPHLLAGPIQPVLMDAWLAVIHWEDAAQRSLLLDPGQSAYAQMLSRLASTKDRNALQLLAGYFWRPTTPESIRRLIIEKKEPWLAVEMASLVSDEALDSLLERLRAEPPLACLTAIDLTCLKLPAGAQRRLFLMIAASHDNLAWTLKTCVDLSGRISNENRQLAAEVLISCKRPRLEEFVKLLQSDSLLPRESQQLVPSLDPILQWLHGPSTVLRKAAEHLLGEFTVENLAERIEVWPAPMCRAMAGVVVHTQKNALGFLNSLLTSPSPKKRLAGLHIVDWLQCGHELVDRLLSLIDDPKLEVRVRAIDTLSGLHDAVLERLIPELLLDTNTDVVDAAQRACRRLERQKLFANNS